MSALARIQAARSALIVSQPFYGVLLTQLRLDERADVKTMQTDGRSLSYNPQWVAGLNDGELTGTLVHEVQHLALGHHVRRGSRDLRQWNEACDLAVNPMVKAAGFVLPKGVMPDPAFADMTAEQIYAARAARPKEDQGGQKPDQGKPGANGAPGAPGQPGAPGDAPGGPGAPDTGDGPGGIVDAAPDSSGIQEAAAQWETLTRQAAAVAMKAGDGSGNLAKTVAELSRSRFDWRDSLARFIDDTAQRVNDWSRPDRRFLGGDFYMPGKTKAAIAHLAVAIDSSGSINDQVESAFAGALQGVLDSGIVERVSVTWCDATVKGEQFFEAGDAVRLVRMGGGGTAFAPALEHIDQAHQDAAAILYLTDLDAPASRFGKPPAAPVLWLAWGTKTAAPFGEVIPMDPWQ